MSTVCNCQFVERFYPSRITDEVRGRAASLSPTSQGTTILPATTPTAMTSALVPRDRGDFHVAVLCALPLEAEYVIDALDRVWHDTKYDPLVNDDSAYTLGAMGEHNVVIVHMPGMGTTRAATAVSNMNFSYPGVKLALVVGVCGGMPTGVEDEEIVLGDVVISKALIQYDVGKQHPNGFKKTTSVYDTLGAPNEKILGLLSKLETRQYREDLQTKTVAFLQAIQQKSSKAQHPGSEHDVLYPSSYPHQHSEPGECHTCEMTDDVCENALETKCEDLGCNSITPVPRRRLIDPVTTRPVIHIGTMGCANTVMKSGHHRDALARKEKIIAVEMEGAGVWRHGPSMVIKGVCDYADSHKRKRWQRYAAATAAACTKAFLLEWWAPEKRQDQSVETEVNVYFDIPAQRVDTLYGREDELTKIATYFDRSDSQVDRPRVLVLQAMGGQGKSQVALEHCHRTHARHTHHGIFWLDGSSSLATTQSWVAVARQISESATEALPDDDARVRFAVRTFERWSYRWLMVFDNCDDATTFSALRQKFLPKAGRGDVLFTSRHQGLGELGTLIQIPPMPHEAGVQLLLHRYGTDIDHSEYMAEGLKIVDRLGGLALAIDQASAFMQHKQLPLDQLDTFLPLYSVQCEEVLRHTTSDLWNYMKIHGSDERQTAVSAFTTWEMSFQQLLDDHDRQDEVAHLFTLSAFFASTFVDESLFRLYLERHVSPPSWMAPFFVPSNTVLHTAAIREEDSEAASCTRDRHTARFVRLYERVVHRTNKKPHPTVLPGRTPQAIKATAADVDHRSWHSDYFWNLVYRAFQMSLVQAISPAAEPRGASFLFHPLIRDWLQLRLAPEHRRKYTREAIDVLCSSIRVHKTRGSDAQIKAAILLHVGAVLVCDDEFFDDQYHLGQDMSTYDSSYWFATFYQDQGQYAASLDLFRTQLTTTRRVLGVEHPNTLTSMSNLAAVLSDQGKHDDAEQMHRQALEVKERVLGVEHSNTLTSMNNLALVLSRQGKHDDAEQMHRRALEVKERVLGVEHSNTLTSMNNLAGVLSDQGKFVEAEKIQLQAVRSSFVILSLQHPNTKVFLRVLFSIGEQQGRERSEMERTLRDIMQHASSPSE